jgi:hypothetical protein
VHRKKIAAKLIGHTKEQNMQQRNNSQEGHTYIMWKMNPAGFDYFPRLQDVYFFVEV